MEKLRMQMVNVNLIVQVLSALFFVELITNTLHSTEQQEQSIKHFNHQILQHFVKIVNMFGQMII